MAKNAVKKAKAEECSDVKGILDSADALRKYIEKGGTGSIM